MPARKETDPFVLFAVLASIVLALAWLTARFAVGLGSTASYLLGINAATALLYLYDKAVAGGRYLRVPEAVLHGAALAGGTPAAFAAQLLLSHKTRKGSFQTVFRLIAAFQACVLVLWLLGR
jgi:uncharacterized membrane protein YsdA (DUF1294 family)